MIEKAAAKSSTLFRTDVVMRQQSSDRRRVELCAPQKRFDRNNVELFAARFLYHLPAGPPLITTLRSAPPSMLRVSCRFSLMIVVFSMIVVRLTITLERRTRSLKRSTATKANKPARHQAARPQAPNR